MFAVCRGRIQRYKWGVVYLSRCVAFVRWWLVSWRWSFQKSSSSSSTSSSSLSLAGVFRYAVEIPLRSESFFIWHVLYWNWCQGRNMVLPTLAKLAAESVLSWALQRSMINGRGMRLMFSISLVTVLAECFWLQSIFILWIGETFLK